MGDSSVYQGLDDRFVRGGIKLAQYGRDIILDK
jgi:hypothetical protein